MLLAPLGGGNRLPCALSRVAVGVVLDAKALGRRRSRHVRRREDDVTARLVKAGTEKPRLAKEEVLLRPLGVCARDAVDHVELAEFIGVGLDLAHDGLVDRLARLLALHGLDPLVDTLGEGRDDVVAAQRRPQPRRCGLHQGQRLVPGEGAQPPDRLQDVLAVRRDLTVLGGVKHEEHVRQIALMRLHDPRSTRGVMAAAVRLVVHAAPAEVAR